MRAPRGGDRPRQTARSEEARPGRYSPLSRRSALGVVAGLTAAVAAPTAFAKGRPAARKAPTRGFNLPGWFDRRDGKPPGAAVLEKLRGLSFETIRLPVDPGLVTGGGAADRRAFLKRIDDALGTLRLAGFAVILDLHPGGDFQSLLRSDPEEAATLAEAAWDGLAAVVAGHPADAVFPELLNEPPLDAPAWLSLRGRLAALVRQKCPRHTLVWGPARFQGIWELTSTPPLDDDNQIASVHYYWPMGFTHQCENWEDTPLARLRNLPFPAIRQSPQVAALYEKFRETGDAAARDYLDGEFASAWTADHIRADIEDASRWSRLNNCPVILDEFGVLDFCVDPMSRANWIGVVRRATEANGIGWTYWELDQGFGFIRDRRSTEGFDRSVIAALVSP